ncbi:S-layer homology domain-containing protein [uncultured Oscillibacter sp.]
MGDVGTWYHEAVDYVLRNKLMGGYGGNLFGPNDTLARAQFA